MESSGRGLLHNGKCRAHHDHHEAIPQVRLFRFLLQVKKSLAASSLEVGLLLQV
jgi:hypothetical protein